MGLVCWMMLKERRKDLKKVVEKSEEISKRFWMVWRVNMKRCFLLLLKHTRQFLCYFYSFFFFKKKKITFLVLNKSNYDVNKWKIASISISFLT